MSHNIFDFASGYYLKAYEIRKSVSDCLGIFESDYNNSMGILCLVNEENDKAMSYFHKALDIRKQYLGDNHEKVADTLVNIGQAYKNFLLYQEALDCCNKALSIYEDVLGLQRRKIANLLYNIAIIEAEMGNYSYSITIFEKAVMIYKDLDCSDDQYFSNAIEWIVYLREKVFLNKSEVKVIGGNRSVHSITV